MWPDSGPAAAEPAGRPFKVVFVSASGEEVLVDDPASFAFDSPFAFRPVSLEAPDLLRTPTMQKGPKQFLGLSEKKLNEEAADPVSGWSVWQMKESGFRSAFSDAELFTVREPAPQLITMLTDNLGDAGFSLPAFEEEEVIRKLPGWEIRVVLDLDKEGIPQHVLVEKSSGNRDIDAFICRQILLGRAASKKETRSGRVTVSYGLE